MKWDKPKESASSLEVFKGTQLAPRCYTTHPGIKIGKGKLYGGNSDYPAMKTAQIYVSLTEGGRVGHGSDPWEEQKRIEVCYPIQDMHVPVDITRFKQMVTWLCNQLHEGRSVHVGCMGGHGRTGTVLAAIVAQGLEEKDAIQYVRKHYCSKAVESQEQVDFLRKHYHVSKAPGAKMGRIKHPPAEGWTMSAYHEPMSHQPVKLLTGLEPSVKIPLLNASTTTKTFAPMSSTRCVWRSKKK